MEYTKKITVSDKLDKYCYCASKDDYIELSEWENGEGFDVRIKDNIYTFTDGELDAMFHLRNCIRYKDKEKTE